MQGQGQMRYENGDIYKGSWVAGKKHGTGTLTTQDGQKYEGTWNNDQKSGLGVQYYADKTRFEGTFVEGKRQGEGKITNGKQFVYLGSFENDAYYTGKGVL